MKNTIKKNGKNGKNAKKSENLKPIAVLLMAYGSPENIDEVEPYYTHIRGGVRPAEALIKNLKDRYARVGGKTPLHAITKEQADRLQSMLDGKSGKGKYKVCIGMKHWNPFIKETCGKMREEGIEKVIAIALAPHYSKISIGGYQKSLDEAASGMAVTMVERWHTNPYLIDCIADQLQAALMKFSKNDVSIHKNNTKEKPHIIFTAHSLPERIKTWNDPYPDELLQTCHLVIKKVHGVTTDSNKNNDIEWSFAFQSAGMTGEPWLGPDINDALTALADSGKKNIIVCPIGFVSDNLEIIYDLDIESQALAALKEIHLERTSLRNIHPLFIEALYSEVIARS